MQKSELQAMTVIQLRKLAKENGVKLGAGIDKAGIVERLLEHELEEIQAAEAPAQPEVVKPDPKTLHEASLSADVTSALPGSGYRAWNNPQQHERPAFRQAWQRPAQQPVNKPSWQRTTGPANRFGPQSRQQAPEQEMQPVSAPAQPDFQRAPVQQPDFQRPAMQQEMQPRPAAPQQDNAPRLDGYRLGYRAAPQRPAYQNRNDYGQRDPNYGGYQPRSNYQQNNYNNSGYQPRNNYQQQGGYQQNNYRQNNGGGYGYQPRSYAPQQSAEQNYNDNLYRLGRDQQFAEQMEAGQLPDLMQVAPSEPAEGILEILPDGYGFLRGRTLQPGRKDVYVSMAQIRRYGLRTGDRVEGGARQQRENDKYAALLTVEKINGEEAVENAERLSFDQLVPVYPNRRIVLESTEDTLPAIRLVDLIAPMGFGQRAMIVAPPESNRLVLLREMSRAIKRNDPDAEVLMLLIDVAPEEVTEISEDANAEVFASTFADAPETQTRVSETMLERAQRLVEMNRNVVILLDSLTKLTRAYQAVLSQGGRPMTNTVTPAALVRPKRFFGAARNTREAGSLTVIATIASETGSRVDEIIFEEFKGTANMELFLCTEQPGDPVQPMIDLQLSGTKKEDMLLTAEQKEGLRAIRKVLGSATNGEAVVQLIDLMQKTKSNADLLERLKEWLALWEKSGYLRKS
ncbi:MAG: transcription termination factor Rho [Clostridia bacterium]|nr:transcription termination factor Rho [Clostridia bacterium]